ncbi:hypothetical protein HC026_09070 [Lactobacillus sp. LC28-10]|uniref:Uncharacterized protein n=1 Tax=Secundilactobacillus angelensis TaxID=2722706 RepID=A0ABX1L0S5_9LACO|nr:hypothetical protein [Secundilactobacillus angelensis]MCH5462321.1 hypothetical protein [Secundilactobacillus angelensis]NLR19060.1 hypothetical protein [Secundilactobacillus angelensis]
MSKQYQSPYAGLNTNNRFSIAKRLAAVYHLDVSQVLFTYLKVAEPILRKGQPATQISEASQKRIDQQFENTLQHLSQTRER